MTKVTGNLQIAGNKWKFPMNWNEVTRAQVLAVFKSMSKFGTGGLFDLHFIKILLRLRLGLFRAKRSTRFIIKELPSDAKLTIVHSPDVLGWFFDQKKNPMPYIIRWFFFHGKLYVGPNRRLNKLSVSELCFAMWYHQRYHKSQNVDNVYKLIDVLYRPVSIRGWLQRLFSSDPKSDIRVPLNDFLHEKRADKFKKLPQHICVIVLAQWSTAQAEFAKRYKLAFRSAGNKKENPRDMVKFLISAAGDKFGLIDQAERASADKVFEFVEMQLEQAEKLPKPKKK
jgi:hypothetical protein